MVRWAVRPGSSTELQTDRGRISSALISARSWLFAAAVPAFPWAWEPRPFRPASAVRAWAQVSASVAAGAAWVPAVSAALAGGGLRHPVLRRDRRELAAHSKFVVESKSNLPRQTKNEHGAEDQVQRD